MPENQHGDPDFDIDAVIEHSDPYELAHLDPLELTQVVNRLTSLEGVPEPFRTEIMNERRRHVLDASVSVEIILAQKKMIEDAEMDAVTKVPLRSVFKRDHEAIVRRRSVEPFPEEALMIIDANRLKVVNDELGHDAGDDYLFTIAEKIKESLRPGDRIFRIGGDEFALLLRGVPSQIAALAIRERTKRVVSGALHHPAEFLTGVSIGYHLLEYGQTADEHFVLADMSLKADKDAFYAAHPEVERRGKL